MEARHYLLPKELILQLFWEFSAQDQVAQEKGMKVMYAGENLPDYNEASSQHRVWREQGGM